MSPADRQVMQANVAIAARLDAEEAKGILKLNRIRIELGLGALAIDERLCDTGRDHSKDMREKNFFAHESPVPGKETPFKRAERFNTKACAENIYMGSTSGEKAIEAWWHSPGHHKNMVSQCARTGLGHVEGHWTQMFGR